MKAQAGNTTSAAGGSGGPSGAEDRKKPKPLGLGSGGIDLHVATSKGTLGGRPGLIVLIGSQGTKGNGVGPSAAERDKEEALNDLMLLQSEQRPVAGLNDDVSHAEKVCVAWVHRI